MRRYLPYLLLLFSLALFGYTFLFSGAGEQVALLEDQLEMQLHEQERIAKRVAELRSILIGIQTDPDVLEKVAREELRMMAQDEELVLFERR